MEILQVCKISPSPSPTAEFSLPLTFFDIVFFSRPPTKRILFYSFPADERRFDSVLQNLKHSLALALSHYLPFAGSIVWPNHSPEPFILYKPGDSVSLTIAKTDADFNHLSSNHVRKANQSHFLVPELPASGAVAPAMSLQITLFPNTGLSIAITTNHVVTDGKTSTMFLKSWASLCSRLGDDPPTLPLALTPVFDRTAAKDPSGLQTLYVKYFAAFNGPPLNVAISDDVVSATFELARADIENLRRKVSSSRYLTSFVLTYAHVSTYIIKAQRMEPRSKIVLFFPVDWRPRVGFLGGGNYFGNGVSGYGLCFEAREFEEENAMAIISNKISDGLAEVMENVKGNDFVGMLDGIVGRWEKEIPTSKFIMVGGSPRFGIYDIDFGLGGCKKVEMVSITPGRSFSMAESRNGNGGVEVGIVLPSEAMSIFSSLFSEGVKNYVN